ncbi:KOW motif protein [compost metagenome]
MRDCERQVLESLCNDRYCIECSTGIIEGDNIRIIEGPLKGRSSIVKKIDRHKRQAVIQLEFMGDIRLVNVALEIISKV